MWEDAVPQLGEPTVPPGPPSLGCAPYGAWDPSGPVGRAWEFPPFGGNEPSAPLVRVRLRVAGGSSRPKAGTNPAHLWCAWPKPPRPRGSLRDPSAQRWGEGPPPSHSRWAHSQEISYKTLPTADFHRRVLCEIYHDAPSGAFKGYSHQGGGNGDGALRRLGSPRRTPGLPPGFPA